MNLKNNSFNLAQVFFIAAIFTSSFDIFLVFNIGFNFRASQLLMIIPIFMSLFNIINNEFIPPLGFRWLSLWSMFIFLFVPNTNFISASIGYALWLVFDGLMILSCTILFSTMLNVIRLFRWYIYSFVFVSLFGIAQFISPAFGFADFMLIQQWWDFGIPRINGFSYEPSYYATYLLMGWVICAYLLESKSTLFTRLHLHRYFFIITLALILSSSRAGYIMMFIWYCQYPIRFVTSLINGNFIMQHAKKSLLIFGIALLAISYENNLDFLYQGLGIDQNASHSVDDRMVGIDDNLTVFFNSPLIGYSLGGVYSAIAELHGATIYSLEDIKEYTGICVFLEVLAASGLIGFVPFSLFIWSIISKPLCLARKVSSEQRKILVALTLSLIIELAILQFNQNILRAYLWFHIGVLATCYSVFTRFGKTANIKKNKSAELIEVTS